MGQEFVVNDRSFDPNIIGIADDMVGNPVCLVIKYGRGSIG